MMAESFAFVNVAEVNFYGGDSDSGDRITNGDAGVGIGGWIDE